MSGGLGGSSGGGGSDITAVAGDLTGSGEGSVTVTIAANAVTNAKLANMATATFKGRTTSGTSDPEDLTATQATAMLNAMVGDSGSGGTKGLVPAPAAGDTAASKFLKADGTWAVISIPTVTAPVAYTPTFTGFGTVSVSNFFSWRVGAALYVYGTFTAGNTTGTEARISLGFNGTDGNVTSISTYPTLQIAGLMTGSTAASTFFGELTVLVEASKAYMVFGRHSSTTNGNAKLNGDAAFTSTAIHSLSGIFLIDGWTASN